MSATATLNTPSPWIINRNQDLFWFSGSALLGYVLIAMAFAFGGLPGKLAAAIGFMVDNPHVYSTATRVVLDGKERAKLGLIWLLLFPLCLIGPVVTWMIGFTWFFLIIAALSAYHIAKQHMGFVMIYKRKAREREDFKLDKYFTLASLLLPFLYYLLAVLFDRFLLVFLIPAIGLAAYYASVQLKKVEVNQPKLLLLAFFIPLQWFAWSYAAMDPHSPVRLLAAAVAINIGHSFQYLRLMYFHNHNRYSQRGGLLQTISRKWLYFIAAAIVISLPNFFAGKMQDDFISAAMLGFLLFHFVLDSKIWRIRGDAELASALQL